MLRALILCSFLLLALIPAAAAKPDLPVLECDGGGVCVVLRNDQNGTCVGMGIGLQGGVTCVRPRGCVDMQIGFNELGTCSLIVP